MLYKFSLQNRLKFRKVIHIHYISFVVMSQEEKLGGILEKMSKNIEYNFHTFIHSMEEVIHVGS
jgi:hypothetical protein